MPANKAFIFDLDGVLIDSENLWYEWNQLNYSRIFGEKIARNIGVTTGKNIDLIFETAMKLGSKANKANFMMEVKNKADQIYKQAPLSTGLDELGRVLHKLNYHMAIVSASPKEWVNEVVERLPFKNNIQIILSLHDRPDLAHKPAPDGYNEVIQALNATPESTIILEDTNIGIASAKASRATVIGLKQNLRKGYEQEGADIYADTIKDVVDIAKAFIPT